MSLVEELQSSALSSSVPISDLLRRSLFVAHKLGIHEFSEWIAFELHGYPDGEKIPDYRQVRGELIAVRPYWGPTPVHIESDELADVITRFPFGESVSKIESLVASAKSDPSARISREFPAGCLAMLKQLSVATPDCPLYFGTDATQLNELLNKVRHIILEWSLKLERDGIIGEGMSFSREEKRMAESHHHNYGTIIGTMNQSQIQQHTQNSTQSYESGASLAEIGNLVKDLRKWVDESALSIEDQNELQADLATVQSQLESPKPKNGIISAGLNAVKSVLEKAAIGALTAQAPIVAEEAHQWVEQIASHLPSLPG